MRSDAYACPVFIVSVQGVHDRLFGPFWLVSTPLWAEQSRGTGLLRSLEQPPKIENVEFHPAAGRTSCDQPEKSIGLEKDERKARRSERLVTACQESTIVWF